MSTCFRCVPTLIGLALQAISLAQSCADVDGNVYNTVQVGSQLWMAENLRTTRYANGDAIATGLTNLEWGNTLEGAYAYPSNNEAYNETHGKLYNGYAVQDPRGLCPDGWLIPSDSAWASLEVALGLPVSSAFNVGMRGVQQNVGGQLKATTFWDPPNTGATNSTGFSALASGNRDTFGNYPSMNTNGDHWTSTWDSPSFMWGRYVYNFSGGIYRSPSPATIGFSCRCLYGQPVGMADHNDRAITLTSSPNPTAGSALVTLTGSAERAVPLRMLNALGQTLFVTTLNADQRQVVNLSSYANGVYLLEVRFANGVRAIERVVKE